MHIPIQKSKKKKTALPFTTTPCQQMGFTAGGQADLRLVQ